MHLKYVAEICFYLLPFINLSLCQWYAHTSMCSLHVDCKHGVMSHPPVHILQGPGCSHWMVMVLTLMVSHFNYNVKNHANISHLSKETKKRKELWIKPALWTSGCWHLVLISDWFKDICDSSVNKCCTVGRWFDLEISESQRQTWNLIEVAGFRSSAAEGLQGETYSMTHGVDFSLCGIHPL